MSSSMSDRKAELERKKARLQAIRDEKKRKENERITREQSGGASKVEEAADAASAEKQDLRNEAELILKEVGIAPGVSSHSTSKSSLGSSDTSLTVPSVQQKKVNLSQSKITQTNILPKELVSYSKETQTPSENPERDARSVDYYALTYVDLDNEDNESVASLATPPVPGPRSPRLQPLLDTSKQEPKQPPCRLLTDEESKQIMEGEDFGIFFDRTTRLVERALTEQVDIFTDYSGADQISGDVMAEGERIKLSRFFFDERWSRHRTITCMDWSQQFPELLVASYNQNEEAVNEPDGVALIWNLKFKKDTPEYIFHCQSAVMSTCFAKFHPHLVVGGTYSGQIVLWDNRSHKRTPVQRSALSAAAHTHPVVAVNVIGSQNAHNLISVSTDGKLCSWSLEMLSQPQDVLELQHSKQTKAVASTSLSFLSGDVNNFVVGSEEGTVYSACRHGNKTGIGSMMEGHQGPITGIHTHSVQGSIDFSQYFLSSSFDWTVKLWDAKDNKLLHSFEDNNDYVYDVQWSPVHPALFATVDGTGRFDLWNLNNASEVPTASIVTDSTVALNRCRWHSTGQHIGVGDDNGRVHIYDVADSLALPRLDDWHKFSQNLQELRSQQASQDEESGLGSLTMLPIR